MKGTLDKAIRTKTITKDELGKLLKYFNLPENKDKYYLMNDPKEDRIGKYRILVLNPLDKEKQEKIKLYEKETDRDLIAYKIRYYDILREFASNTKKSMQLYVLQKNIEYVFSKELKIAEKTNEFKELKDLLEKIKKARSYFTLKMFLDDNKSDKKKKSSKNVRSKKTASKPNDHGHLDDA